MDPRAFQRISDLEQVHRAIDRAVLGWRVALLTGQAVDVFQRATCGLLRWHIEAEERVILPVYAERVSEPPHGGSVPLIARDHRIITDHLDAVLDLVGLEALSRLARLAETLEHHDEREANSYVALLPECLSEAEERSMMASVADGFLESWIVRDPVCDTACIWDVDGLIRTAMERASRLQDPRFETKVARLQRALSEAGDSSLMDSLKRLATLDRLNRLLDAASQSQR